MCTHRNTLNSVFDGFNYESLCVENSNNMKIVSPFEKTCGFNSQCPLITRIHSIRTLYFMIFRPHTVCNVKLWIGMIMVHFVMCRDRTRD